jgi:tolloid protein
VLYVAKWGAVGHEIGHALGLTHEHQRPDRDQHVIILENHVEESLLHNFDLSVTTIMTTYGIPYDLGSIMHYASNVGSCSYLIYEFCGGELYQKLL